MGRQLTSPESLNHPRQSSIIRTLLPEHSLYSVQIHTEPFLFPCQNSFGNFLSSFINTCMGAYLLAFLVHFLPYVRSSSNHLESILQPAEYFLSIITHENSSFFFRLNILYFPKDSHLNILANTRFQPSFFSPVMIPLVSFSTKT